MVPDGVADEGPDGDARSDPEPGHERAADDGAAPRTPTAGARPPAAILRAEEPAYQLPTR